MRFFASISLVLTSGQLALASSNLVDTQAQISSYAAHAGKHHSSSIGCDLACGFLNHALSGKVSYPKSADYERQESAYWSQQQALTRPSCRLSPTSARDVSIAVLTSRVTKCNFAVKSGGHAAFAGASNIQDGITIDLANLNEIKVSNDKKSVSVGAGNVWYDVYQNLLPQNLTVIGGRVSAIGVGGLTLGGGISFFSTRHGWACDNVDSYEVVFADGSIRNVSYKSKYSDLYWALRGGGNNFGIVTKFQLAAYPQGDLWAGSQTFLYSKDTSAAINNAFANFAIHSPSDTDAQIIIAYAYAQTQGIYVIASDLQYAKPTVNPPILNNFTSIPGPIADTLRVVSLPDLANEFNATNPNGFRQTYWTFTVKNDAELMSQMVDFYREEVEKIKDAMSIVPSLIFQPISTAMTSHFTKNGGNPLGLANQGPLNLINVDISWMDPADDKRIIAAAKAIVDKSIAAAKEKKLDHPYLYQNYAALQQDVFSSYGKNNYDRLKTIQAKYDPQRVWQKLQPGYFKL